MEFYIGQIFEDMYPQEAAEWCNNNRATIEEIAPVVRPVAEEYQMFEEDGGNGKVVTKTRYVEKELRCFEIVALPEPTIEEQNEVIQQTRASLYANLIDPLHAERQRKVVLGTWTEEMEAEYVAKVQELTAQIQTENPYIETVD